jgi:hypothetical protein
MRNQRAAAILSILLACMVFGSWERAFAQGSEVATVQSFIAVDKNAPGTKLSGPMGIFYSDVNFNDTDCGGSDTPSGTMTFILRLRKGNQLYGFSGPDEPTRVCLADPGSPDDPTSQQGILHDFVRDHVIPVVSSNPEAPFALKSVDQMVNNDTPGYSSLDVLFVLLDVEIAVRE